MRSGARAPVVAIALDSMDVGLVREGIREGWLPTIGSIVERGRSGTLSGFQHYVPGASWPTVVTSAPVGDHQVVLDRQLKPGAYKIERVSFRGLRRPPFWSALTESGLRATVASVYSAPLIEPFLGAQLVGWGAHDPFSMWRVHVDPPELLDRVTAEIGERGVAEEGPFRTHSDYRRNLAIAMKSVSQHGRGLRFLMRDTGWDLFLAGITEAHHAGHRLWHYHDATHPAHDAGAPDDLKMGIANLYRVIDESLGLVFREAPKHAPVVLFSPHGMEPNRLLGDPIPVVLERGGWLSRRYKGDGSARVRAYAAFRATVQRTVPSSIRKVIGRHVPTDLLLTQVSLRNVDAPKTRAFPLPSDRTGFIRLNVIGREPEGTVARGQDYDRLCEELSAGLRELVNADTGAPAVVEVVRTDTLTGAQIDDVLPDLIVRWDVRSPLRRIMSGRLGTIEIPKLDPRTGQHAPRGWIAAAGPEIRSDGGLFGEDVGRIEDVGPTILALLGAPQPEGLAGTPIEGIAP